MFVQVLTAFLLLANDDGAKALAEWREIQGDGFALRMPGTPEFSEKRDDAGLLGFLAKGRKRLWKSWLGKGKETFFFEVTDVEVPLPGVVPTERLLEKYCTVFYAPFGGKLERRRDVEIRAGRKRWPGCDV